MSEQRQIGDLRVWWIPQVPMKKPFIVLVASAVEGAKILDVLADYDLFQYENRIKPDYSNVGGLERWCDDDGSGKPGWEDWEDEETGESDPVEWLRQQPGLR